MAGLQRAGHLDDARAVFLFRTTAELDYHHRDVPRQKELLRGVQRDLRRRGRWLHELDRTPAFYFDSITQLRVDTWSRGRVTLVGDAGYCPGPAVGGSTSLAVFGAYVLAGELARSGGDHAAAYASYERTMMPAVLGSRSLARVNAKTIVPGSRWGVRALIGVARMVSVLPLGFTQTLARLNSKGIRLYDSMPLPDYPAVTTA